jgi:hypothetical protein
MEAPVSDQTLCDGCRDDYYNHGEGKGKSMSGNGCASLASATAGTYWLLHWWTAPTVPGAFTETRKNSCWHSPGTFAKYKPEQVPPFAQGRNGKHPVTGAEPRDR